MSVSPRNLGGKVEVEMSGPLTLDRTKRVGDREYAYLYQVVPGDVHWYYMPYGVAHMYLNEDPRLIDWWELRRRYGMTSAYGRLGGL